MGWMANARVPLQALLLVTDIVATVLVYCIGLLIGILSLSVFHPELMELIHEFASLDGLFGLYASLYEMLIVEKGLLFCPPDYDVLDLRFISDLLSLGVYAALFTPVWLWVWLLGLKAWPLFKWTGGVLRANKFPVGSTMTVGSTLFALVAMGAIYGLQHQLCV